MCHMHQNKILVKVLLRYVPKRVMHHAPEKRNYISSLHGGKAMDEECNTYNFFLLLRAVIF